MEDHLRGLGGERGVRSDTGLGAGRPSSCRETHVCVSGVEVIYLFCLFALNNVDYLQLKYTKLLPSVCCVFNDLRLEKVTVRSRTNNK